MTERDRKILELYSQGRNTVTIAKEIGVNPSTVQRVLKKNGIRIQRRDIEVSPEEWNDIVQRFQDGERLKSIYQSYTHLFGCPETLSKMLERKGVKTGCLKGGHDRLPVDDYFFSVIDTEAKAYFLGLMISDGSVINSKNIISIELEKEDRYILEQFRELLKSEHAITPSRSCFRYSFTSEIMHNDLKRYGVVPNKTEITRLPEIQEPLMRHLIRGIFDGDGTVYRRLDVDGKRRCSFGFYGSETLLRETRAYLNQKLGLSLNKIHPKEGCYMLYYGKLKDIKAFYDYIYVDATYYLRRKKEVFDSYLADTERACITSPCNA